MSKLLVEVIITEEKWTKCGRFSIERRFLALGDKKGNFYIDD